ILSNKESITKTVLKDNTIQYKSNYYSVPLGTYQPQKKIKVRVVVNDTSLSVFELKSDQQIATHLLAKGKGKLTKDP
ncbi:IS21 family transposase, partial [Enterococcus faecium]